MGLCANFGKVVSFNALSPSGTSGLYQVSLGRQARRNTLQQMVTNPQTVTQKTV
jgi:hypothetical protein